MEAREVREIMEAYASMYSQVIAEAECEDEEESEEEETPKMNGKKKEKKEKEEKEDEMKEEVDLFDYLLEYLVAEGYADTNKAALAIMANMSEEWKQSIVEGEERKEEPQKPFTGEGPKKPKGWKPTGPKLKTGQRPGYAR
jgi:hypothetical protein